MSNRTVVVIAVLLATLISPAEAMRPDGIVIGRNASEMERYAARELQRYFHQLSGAFVPIETGGKADNRILLGQRGSNELISKVVSSGELKVGADFPGPQGYVLKSLDDTFVIAGSDDTGVLYGVYGLLDDYFDVGFYLTGDVLPARKPLDLPTVDVSMKPKQYIRGFLPWTNFPQSATSWSLEDYEFIIDQMAKMRMNFIHIHNYTGEQMHNEMFHNFEWNGTVPRTWFATARTGHGWSGPAWDVNRYLFGAADLFDDYDFGSDATLHNEGLSNLDVHSKGITLFQQIIAYAHRRGVRIGLGIGTDWVPKEYQTSADNPDLLDARVEQISQDYPNLDYLLCFRSENIGKDAQSQFWRDSFQQFYDRMKKRAPQIRMAVSGWGINAKAVADLPDDVICAPISHYSAGWDDGSIYGKREYWACPWLERDFNSSVHYYPYNVNLSETIANYDKASSNTVGLLCLTWRLGDAVEPKMWYIAKAPWDQSKEFTSSRAVYADYARRNYGDALTSEVTGIINENEAYANDVSECQGTVDFSNANRAADRTKARQQIDTIAKAIEQTTGSANRSRLEQLRQRLVAVEAFCALDQSFKKNNWSELPAQFDDWARCFVLRVNDISSLGNLVSSQNRLVQLRYVPHERSLRKKLDAAPPAGFDVRGTTDGVMISWKAEPDVTGYNVYENGERLNDAAIPAAIAEFTFRSDAKAAYTIASLTADGKESTHSIPIQCAAGYSDNESPAIFVVSPPKSVARGRTFDIKARLLDGRSYDCLSASLLWRALDVAPDSEWHKLPMLRRAQCTFAVSLPANSIPNEGFEYYIVASDSKNESAWPVGAPNNAASCVCDDTLSFLASGAIVTTCTDSRKIEWTYNGPPASMFRIYRGPQADFQCDVASRVTFVGPSTSSFVDAAEDFSGRPLEDSVYYRVTSVDRIGRESEASNAVLVKHQPQKLNPYQKLLASGMPNRAAAERVPCPEGHYAVRVSQMGYQSFGPMELDASTTLMNVRMRTLAGPFRLQVRADDADGGELLADVPVDPATNPNMFFTKMFAIKPYPGQHTLYVQARNEAQWIADIHWIMFRRAGDPLEAEDAELRGARVYDDGNLLSGKGVGFFGNEVGSLISFEIPESNEILVYYAQPAPQPRQCTLYSGKKRVGTVQFPTTGDWYKYGTVRVSGIKLQTPLVFQIEEEDLAVNGAGNYCINMDKIEVKQR